MNKANKRRTQAYQTKARKDDIYLELLKLGFSAGAVWQEDNMGLTAEQAIAIVQRNWVSKVLAEGDDND